jgi:hypothetical protein
VTNVVAKTAKHFCTSGLPGWSVIASIVGCSNRPVAPKCFELERIPPQFAFPSGLPVWAATGPAQSSELWENVCVTLVGSGYEGFDVGDLFLHQIQIGPRRQIGQTITQMLKSTRKILLLDQYYSQQLLGVRLHVRRIHR